LTRVSIGFAKCFLAMDHRDESAFTRVFNALLPGDDGRDVLSGPGHDSPTADARYAGRLPGAITGSSWHA
jgi:hypothetical protein